MENQNATASNKEDELESDDLPNFSNSMSVSIENDLTSEWNEINNKCILRNRGIFII